MANSNQSLAAEPSFHSDPPRRGGFAVTTIRRFPDYRSELAEQQSENGLALASGPAQALSFIVKDGTGSASVETAAWIFRR